MTKHDLIRVIASREGVSFVEAQRRLDVALDAIVESVWRDGALTLTGFGTFELKERKPRPGRHPATGEPLFLRGGHRVAFRAGTRLKERA